MLKKAYLYRMSDQLHRDLKVECAKKNISMQVYIQKLVENSLKMEVK
jgi:predicted HicB family RNase H-like nuclease